MGEDDWNKESKEFRCPFRTEKGAVCGVYQGRLNEVLNHFYRHHFERTSKESIYEEPLACFHANCHHLIHTHDKLVKHMQTHGHGADSIYFIKYIIDHTELIKNNAVASIEIEKEKLKKQHEEEKAEMNVKLENALKTAEDSKAEAEKEKSKLTKMVDTAKEDARHYRRKADNTKKEVVRLTSEVEDMKKNLEKLQENKIKLEIKLGIQKKDNEDLQIIKRAHEACGDTRLGEKVKKQEKMIKKLRRLVEEKARRLTKYEIRGDESEEEEDIS